jgi:hypothetical protein
MDGLHPWLLRKCWYNITFTVHVDCRLLEGNIPQRVRAAATSAWIGELVATPWVSNSISGARNWVKTASSFSLSESGMKSPGAISMVPPWPPSARCITSSSISEIDHTLSVSGVDVPQKSIMRNFTDCKIIMFKHQKQGFSNPFLGLNFIFLEFSIKMCLLLSLCDLITS